jgi:hypothetical protein
MGGAELILGPVVLLTGVLAGVILGVDTVNVLEPVAVTASMEQRGLSSEVVTHRLITRLAQIADSKANSTRSAARTWPARASPRAWQRRLG